MCSAYTGNICEIKAGELVEVLGHSWHYQLQALGVLRFLLGTHVRLSEEHRLLGGNILRGMLALSVKKGNPAKFSLLFFHLLLGVELCW